MTTLEKIKTLNWYNFLNKIKDILLELVNISSNIETPSLQEVMVKGNKTVIPLKILVDTSEESFGKIELDVFQGIIIKDAFSSDAELVIKSGFLSEKITLVAPNKPEGEYVIATTDDLEALAQLPIPLDNVLTNGNITTKEIKVYNTLSTGADGSRITKNFILISAPGVPNIVRMNNDGTDLGTGISLINSVSSNAFLGMSPLAPTGALVRVNFPIKNGTYDMATIQDLPQITNDFADDAAASIGGIPVGGLYHTSGTVKIRLT